MTVFELKILAVTLSKLPGPTHQLVLCTHIYTLTVQGDMALPTSYTDFSAKHQTNKGLRNVSGIQEVM